MFLVAVVLTLVASVLAVVTATDDPAAAINTAPGDGIAVYGEASNTTPRVRTYDGAGNSFAAEGDTVAGATGVSMVTRTSPRKQEAMNAYVTTGGVMRVMCYDGTAWSNEWNVTVGGTGTTRRFDIAYETSTGDAVVVYSTNAAPTNELAYRVHDGGSGCGSGWSSAANIDATGTSGVPAYVKIGTDPRPGSELMTMVYVDANNDMGGFVWSGSMWTNEPTIFDANVGATASAPDLENFDVEYESLSGDVMVMWSKASSYNTNGAYYRTCPGGIASCVWGANTSWNATGDTVWSLDITANPLSDEIVFASIGYDGTTDGDLQVGHWSGSAWTNSANLDTSASNPVAGAKTVATGWATNGGFSRSIVVYADATATTTSISAYAGNGGTFTAITDFVGAPVPGAFRWFDLQTDPRNTDRVLLTYNDANSDLFAKRLVLSSTGTWTWTNSDGSAALEASLSQATAGAFSFAYWRNPTSMTQNGYRWYGNTNAIQPTTGLAGENTPATVSASSTIARLRTNVTASDMALGAGASSFDLQYATSPFGPWAPVSPAAWCSTASPLCNTNWASRKKIAIDNSGQASNLTNFAVAVQLNSGNIDYNKTQNAGQDIRFVDADGTALNYEIEKWNESGTSVVWVKVPQIDASSRGDYFWMYYNYASASDAQNKTAVWDSNTVAAYHMNTNPAAACVSTREICDSTTNANNGDMAGSMTSGDLVAAPLGDGLDFDGNDVFTVPDSNSLDITSYTISAWAKAPSFAGSYMTEFCKDTAYCLQTNGDEMSASIYSGGWQVNETSTYNLQVNAWYKYDATFDTAANTWSLYINGIQVKTGAQSLNLSASSNPMYIGASSSSSEFWTGQIDELRINNVNRSDDWIKADYLNGLNRFTKIGNEESNTSGAWKFKDNSTPLDGAAVSSTLLTGSDVAGTYTETNSTALNPNVATIGDDVEYDFALDPANAVANTMYYFRMVRSNGQALKSYANYPMLWYGSTMAQNAYRWYQNADAIQPTTPLAAENTASNGATPVRLRQNVSVSGMNLAAGVSSLKLQYGTSTSGPWTDVGSWCATSSPLCNTSWLTRKKISIDNSTAGSLTDFTTLVQLSASNIDYAKTQNSGQDLRFVDADGTALNYEIENWNESGTSNVWVKIPKIDGYTNSDYFWIYYDNAAASAGQSASATFDSSTKMMHHFEETAACATTFTDSTSNGNNGTCSSAPSANVSGKVGYARGFDGVDDYINVVDSASISSTSAYTFSGWFTQSGSSTNRALAGKWDYTGGTSVQESWALQTANSDATRLRLFIGLSDSDDGQNYADTPVGSWTTGSWHHVAWTFDSTGSTNADKYKIYIDGVSQTLTFTGTMSTTIRDTTAALRIGDYQGLNRYWNGSIDEVGIDNVARSADWVRARYNSQNTGFNSFGSAEGQASSGWVMYNNATPADGAAVSGNLLTGSDVAGRYSESIPSSTNPNAVNAGQEMEVDWALDGSLAAAGTYYFRIVKADGTALDTYTTYPTFTAGSQFDQTTSRWYQNIDAVQPTTPLAAENAPASIASSSTIARLRQQLSVSNSNLATGGQAFKLQYGTSTNGTWTDVTNWWNSSWTARRKITFNNSASSENLTNFPVRVSLSSSNIDYAKTQNSGQDIRFVDGDGTLLKHEIEKWDEAGTSEVWVKVPQIDAGSTTDYIYAYYGNAGAADGQDAANVWDSNNVMVWHLNETAGAHQDSTANNLDSTTQSPEAQGTATGKIAGADDFERTGGPDYIQRTHDNALNLTNAFTVEAWVNPESIGGSGVFNRIIGKEVSAGTPTYWMELTDSDEIVVGVSNGSTWPSAASSTNAVSTGSLQHVVGTFDNATNTIRVYVNGTQVAINSSVTINPSTGTNAFRLGTSLNGTDTFDGIIDEMRISNSVRSAEWIEAEYITSNNTMNSFGSEEAPASWNFYNNATPANGASVSANLLTGSDVTARYIESNPTGTNPNAVNNGQQMEWDFALDPAAATPGTAYYFRMVKADGSPLDAYTSYPSIMVGASIDQAQYRWYANADGVQPGSALAGQNTAATVSSSATIARLRANLSVSTANLGVSSQAFKLQYGTFTNGTWTDVGSGWWNTSWSNRRKITFNNSASSENLTNFPVRVSLSSSNIDYAKTQNAGQDIRFVDPDGTLLSHEIETWNESGTSEVWVKVPQVDAGSTTDYVYAYYGNAGASDGQSATNVWDANYKGVWHLDENPAGGAPQMSDSTSNANNGTTSGSMGAGQQVAGKISGSLDLDGSNDYVNGGTGASLNNTTNTITLSGWVQRGTSSESGYIMTRGTVGSNGYGIGIGNIASSGCGANQITASKLGAIHVCVGAFPADTNWHHLSVVFSASGVTAYVDGAATAPTSANSTAFTSSAATFRISSSSDNAEYWDGGVDEMRVSSNARSAEWVEAEYVSQNNAMNSFGSEEAPAAWNYYNNATPANGANITSTLLTSSNVNGSYTEGNPTPDNPNAINVGQFGEWDFALDPIAATTGTYYFRITKADGTPLASYTVYPQLNYRSTLDQESYRWYANADSADVGSVLAAKDTAASAPAQGTAFRLRTSVHVGGMQLDVGAQSMKLQYATRSGACDAAFSGESYSDVDTGSGAIRYYNNASPTDGAAATSNANDPATHTKVMQSYEESNNATSLNAVPSGQDGVWDFALVDSSASPGTAYCFRLVRSDGSALDGHTTIPEITTNIPNVAPNAPANLAQTKTDTTPIPAMTVYSYNASTGTTFDALGGTLSVDGTIKRTGAGSMKATGAQDGFWLSDGVGTPRDMSANGRTFSVWVYVPTTNSGTTWTAQMAIYDSAASGYTLGPATSVTRDMWNLVTFTPDPSLISNMTHITVQAYGGSGGANTVYLDDLQQGNGIWTNQTSVRFTGTVTDPDGADTDQLCIEAQPIGTGFTNTEQSCGSLVSQGSTANHTLSSLINGTQYHWQARVRDAGGLYSSWVAYGGNKDTTTASPDFGIDNSNPTTGTVKDGPTQGVDVNYNTGALDTLSGNWTGFSDGSSAIAHYEYSIGTSAGDTTTSGGWITTGATEVTKTGLSLQTSVMYYVNVRAVDVAGNTSGYVTSNGQMVAPTLTFALGATSVQFANLNMGNSYSDNKSFNVGIAANAYGGAVVRSYQESSFASGTPTIPAFNGGTYASPDTWQAADHGFGYTSSDTSVQGANKFQAATCPGGTAIAAPGCFAPFANSGPGDIVADHVSGVAGTPFNDNFTITLRVKLDSNQAAGNYATSLHFSASAVY